MYRKYENKPYDKKIVILTYFGESVIGYQVFQQRIDTIRSFGNIVVISNNLTAKEKLNLKNNEFIYIKQRGYSKIKYLFYLLKIWHLIFIINPKFVFFLHTRYSILNALFKLKYIIFIFWNIDPSQIFIEKCNEENYILRNFNDYFNHLCRKLCYIGAKKSKLVFPASEALMDDLILNGVKKDNLRLIYLGVDDNYYKIGKRDFLTEKKPIECIYTGSINKERGLYLILKFVGLVNKNGKKINFKFVGCNKNDTKIIKGLAKKQNISQYIDIMGIVESSKIPFLLKNADIGISLLEENPYFIKNPSTKLFEYLATGLPVIVNDIPTHTKYVENYRTGIIVKWSAEEIASILNKIYNDRSIIEKMHHFCKIEGEKYRWSKVSELMKESMIKYIQ